MWHFSMGHYVRLAYLMQLMLGDYHGLDCAVRDFHTMNIKGWPNVYGGNLWLIERLQVSGVGALVENVT